MHDLAIEITDLVKIYRSKSKGHIRALDGLSLTVHSGEIFGLLGRNGAGKTTLLRILTTLIPQTSGSARVLGFDVGRDGLDVRKTICAVLQENALEQFLSVKDNLLTFGRFHSLPNEERERRAMQAIEQFGLTEHINTKGMDLSGGMKRRLQVAKVFMVDKPIVFLDEATTGMDPINKRAVLEAIRAQAKNGRTFFLTTHILQEAEELCDSIAMIDKGKIIARGDVNTIKSLASKVFEISVTFESLTDSVVERLRSLSPLRFEQKGNGVEMCVKNFDSALLSAIAEITQAAGVVHFAVNGGTLEDAFVELLGKDAADKL
jgi:ABC-2 type transport system ATP-binding protein